MKTVGEIIHSERQKKEISLEKLSQLTKIDIKYLEAIEKNDYTALPSETFIKGFIRNISLRLDRNPDELVAIFRRDYNFQVSKQENKTVKPKRQRNFVEPNHLLPYIFGLIIFLGYLWFQFRTVLTPPSLKITTPEVASVTTSPVEISGETSVDATISIDDLKVRPDENGIFDTKISLPLGETELTLKAINRFGRSTVKKINFTVISK